MTAHRRSPSTVRRPAGRSMGLYQSSRGRDRSKPFARALLVSRRTACVVGFPVSPPPRRMFRFVWVTSHDRRRQAGEIPGAVVLSGARRDALLRAVGSRPGARHPPRTRETIFDIASLTKPFATRWPETLVDAATSSDYPIGRYLKEFRRHVSSAYHTRMDAPAGWWRSAAAAQRRLSRPPPHWPAHAGFRRRQGFQYSDTGLCSSEKSCEGERCPSTLRRSQSKPLG